MFELGDSILFGKCSEKWHRSYALIAPTPFTGDANTLEGIKLGKVVAIGLLYTNHKCPYALRAMIALERAGIDYSIREILLSKIPDSLLSHSSKGTVPVFVFATGEVLDESRDIYEKFTGCDFSMSEKELISYFDSDIKFHVDRYRKPNRYGVSKPFMHRDMVVQMLQKFDFSTLNSSVSDSIFPFVRQFVLVDANWFESLELPNFKIWYKEQESTTTFQHIKSHYLNNYSCFLIEE